MANAFSKEIIMFFLFATLMVVAGVIVAALLKAIKNFASNAIAVG